MVSDRKLLEQVMAAWQIGAYGIDEHHKAMVLAMTEVGKKLASPRTRPEASFQGCCCRWQGNTLVQQCTLHQAYVATIHEWAERAKTAEAELEERKKNGPAMQQVAADVITTGTGILFNGKRVDPASIYKQEQADPCPGCKKGGVCRTPKCGRLKLPEDHPLRSEKPERPEQKPVVTWDASAPLVMTQHPAFPKPEQEPVAWRNTETGEFCTGGFLRKDWARWLPLYTAPQPAQQPLTDAMVVAAARMLSDRQAAGCNVDCGDMWKLHGNDFLEDARAALEAAHDITRENT